jgi:hypothetical protein
MTLKFVKTPKTPQLCHDKENNQWVMIFDWKIINGQKIASKGTDVTKIIETQLKDFGNYTRRIENIAFMLIEKELGREGIEIDDDSILERFSHYDELANHMPQHPIGIDLYSSENPTYSLLTPAP